MRAFDLIVQPEHCLAALRGPKGPLASQWICSDPTGTVQVEFTGRACDALLPGGPALRLHSCVCKLVGDVLIVSCARAGLAEGDTLPTSNGQPDARAAQVLQASSLNAWAFPGTHRRLALA
jgi:hypothetical protein